MNSKILISIIVPAYNSEKSIERCLNSLLNQTERRFEIIVIDDGSTDKTKAICKKIQEFNNKLYYIYQENKGVSYARNRGIELAKGKYVCFVDSDDYVEDNYLERLISQNNNSELCICGYYRDFYINETFNKNIEILPGKENLFDENTWNKNFLKLYSKAFFNNPWAKMYKMDIINKYNIRFDTRLWYGEDCLFNFLYLNEVKSVSVINICLYHYICKDTESLTSKYSLEKFNVSKDIYSTVKEFIDKRSFITNRYLIDKIYIKSLFLSIESMYNNKMNYKDILSNIKKEIQSKEFINILNNNYKGDFEFFLYKFILKTKKLSLIYFFVLLRLKFKMLYIKY